MSPEYYELLSPELKRVVDEIEEHCGFEIQVQWTKDLQHRGMLQHDPQSMTIHLRTLLLNRASICHEICHAERYYLLGIPFIELLPARQLGGNGDAVDAAANIDNMLEHITVIRGMKERFGFEKDPTHVQEDLSAYEKWPVDEFSRKCFALCNAALVHFHFPELSSRMDSILASEGLTQVSQDLNASLETCLHSKPRMVAALMKALGIEDSQVRLRARTCLGDGMDFALPLQVWVERGIDRYTPEIARKFDNEVEIAPDAYLGSLRLRHKVQSEELRQHIQLDLEKNGWTGRPLLVFKKDGTYENITGTHRAQAAMNLGIQIPAVIIDNLSTELLGMVEGGVHTDELEGIFRLAGLDKAAQLMNLEKRYGNRMKPTERHNKPSTKGNKFTIKRVTDLGD